MEQQIESSGIVDALERGNFHDLHKYNNTV